MDDDRRGKAALIALLVTLGIIVLLAWLAPELQEAGTEDAGAERSAPAGQGPGDHADDGASRRSVASM
jgi:hypothetical protein